MKTARIPTAIFRVTVGSALAALVAASLLAAGASADSTAGSPAVESKLAQVAQVPLPGVVADNPTPMSSDVVAGLGRWGEVEIADAAVDEATSVSAERAMQVARSEFGAAFSDAEMATVSLVRATTHQFGVETAQDAAAASQVKPTIDDAVVWAVTLSGVPERVGHVRAGNPAPPPSKGTMVIFVSPDSGDLLYTLGF